MFYETLKDSHPDLFANTPEETFLARKAELTEHLDTASDVEFLFGLQSLAALVGDSHTSVQVADSVVDQLNAYPMVLSWRDGHWYLTTVPAEEQDLLGAEVTAIGGRSMAEVVKTFGRVLSADRCAMWRITTPIWVWQRRVSLWPSPWLTARPSPSLPCPTSPWERRKLSS